MESKYNERHVELSKLYNRSLEEGRYEDSIVHLDEMIFIAEEENRPNDRARLLEVREGIQMYLSRS